MRLVVQFFENDRSNLVDYRFLKKINRIENRWQKIDYRLIEKKRLLKIGTTKNKYS